MTKTKKTRTLTLSDDVFTGLKTLALLQDTSVSSIVEELGKKYITLHKEELKKYYQQKFDFIEQSAIIAQVRNDL